MASRKRTSSRKTTARTNTSVIGLKRLLSHEYLLKVLYANEWANLPKEYATRMASYIAQMSGHPLRNDKQFQQLVHGFLARAVDRSDTIRARHLETGETRQ